MSKAGKTVKKFLVSTEKISNIIEHNIVSGCASSGPPLGPMLGQRGIPIAKFVQEFNERTKDMIPGIPLSSKITISGRNYKLQINTPTTEYMLKQAAGVKSTLESRGNTIGKITHKHLYEIAKVKITDRYYLIRDYTMEKMCEEISAKAHELGIEVVRSYDPEEYTEFLKRVKIREEEYQQQLLALMEEKKKKLR